MMAVMTVRYVPPEIADDMLGLNALPDRPLTVDDLVELWSSVPENGYRYELDDGVLVVYGAPSLAHQLATTKLTVLLSNTCPREFLVVGGPGVEISPIQYRIPDLTVVRAGTIDLRARNYAQPPALAVEVASPSTGRYDQTRKKQVYAEFGIPDYWIVTPDPQQPDITAFRLDGKHYERVAYASGEVTFTATRPFPVSFTPAELVRAGQS
jgi:Uma2 family endonuclease